VKLLASIWIEFIGLFVDDGALAALCIATITILSAAVLWLALPPLFAGFALLVACIAILAWSATTAARRK
jgi:hypothetical protein